jgi:Cohesin loading factor
MLTDRQNWKLEPRTEAKIRLKYATILYEETENTLEAETTLSNGVSPSEFSTGHR